MHINDKGAYVVTAGLTNNGILGKTDIGAKIFKKKTITVDMFGNAFYRQFDYKMVTHARVFSLTPKFHITERQGLFLANSLRSLRNEFGYENMCSWEKTKSKTTHLPCKDGKIDFDFMESFVAELEAQRIAELSDYLRVSGLHNYELSEKERRVLRDYDNGDIQLKEFKFNNIFDKIVQGRRLKKYDQLPGKIPFVMSGVTNNGVVGYISNPVASFRKNAITVDIFGNSFYRDYDFGAGDDTGVYWSDKVEYSKLTMLYFTAAIQRALLGRFSYGKKLRSSQSYNFVMKLPYKNNEPDFDTMNILISAIQKMVIKDVVKYSDAKINATKKVVQNH